MSFILDVPSTGNDFDLAIVAATISILIGGILFGVGLGFGIRRIRMLGFEEIGQGIISAALVGAIVIFSGLLNSTTAELIPPALSYPSIPNISSASYSFYIHNLESLELSQSSLASALSRASEITGFVSSLKLSLGVVSAQPFFALETASHSLYESSIQLYSLSSLAFFESEFAKFISIMVLTVFLPAGLVFRTFFATRKLGAAAMAIAISAYFVYPLFFLYTFSHSQTITATSAALSNATAFNAKFSSVPILNLEDSNAVRNKINEISQNNSQDDFGSQLQPIFSTSSNAVSLALLDLILYPLISLAVSVVAAFEFYKLLSTPIFLPYFEVV